MRMTNEFRYIVTSRREDLKVQYEGPEGFDVGKVAHNSAYSNARAALEKEIKEVEMQFREDIIAIDRDIQNMEGALENLSSRDERVLAAYVTFNTVKGKETAVQVFTRQSYIDYWSAGCKRRNEFDGVIPYIKEAPEPST